MRVIVKEPGESPKRVTIDGSLESLQRLVGGYIEHISFTKTTGILVNEEGKLRKLAANIILPEDILVGTVVFVGESGEEFVDVPDEEADVIMKAFEIPIGKEKTGGKHERDKNMDPGA